MSWNGTHPVMTRAEAVALLPVGACRITIYLVRCLPAFPTDTQEAATESMCLRCGVRYVPRDIMVRWRGMRALPG